MKAILFPGQGSQKAGMATEFHSNFKIVKDIFSRVDEALNLNLSKIILSGSDEDLKKTEITQPAILTTSFAIFKVLKNEFNFDLSQVKFIAGHSLGEYSALVATESISLEDGVTLVHERGKLMQDAVPEGKGAMLAVMGLSIDELNILFKKVDLKNGICEIANDNSPGQIILSGSKETLNSFSNYLKAEKKRSIFLPVSAPFHCSLMKPAADNMKSFLQKKEIKNPRLQLISNVTALPVKKDDDIKYLLYKQIFSPVGWRETMEYMIKNNINDFIEIGPGKVLSGLLKRINDKVLNTSLTKIEDIKNLK
jgi:[acyl-carrier-protein] S-malonyltransferase